MRTHTDSWTHTHTHAQPELNPRPIDDGQSLSPLSFPLDFVSLPIFKFEVYLKCTPSPSVGASERLTKLNKRKQKQKQIMINEKKEKKTEKQVLVWPVMNTAKVEQKFLRFYLHTTSVSTNKLSELCPNCV